jgi:porphobilinogen deaminase
VSRIVLGTRGSDLARAQTAMVQSALARVSPNIEIAIEIITTRGDENSRHAAEPTDRRAGRKGLFTSEIERSLRDRQIDVAVHSAKDLPSDAADGLEISAALPRAAVEDVLIAKSCAGFRFTPGESGDRHRQRASATSASLVAPGPRDRRSARERADAAAEADRESWEGIVLARAGLERLGFDCSRGELSFEGESLRSSILPREKFLPAAGRGSSRCKCDRTITHRSVIGALSDDATLLCLRAEREFLRFAARRLWHTGRRAGCD